MVDVTEKPGTRRVAIASGILRMQTATLERIRAGRVAKGDVLTVADVGAVMAAKRTSDMIPMCNPVALTGVEVKFREIAEPDTSGCVGIKVVTTASCTGQTGVEMEALCAASVAGCIRRTPLAIATRWVSDFAETSTMRARPASEKCVNLSI